jgi:ABC-type uncharacterized transport system substrate-binding protein
MGNLARMKLTVLSVLAAIMAPSAAVAHPHVFVDMSLTSVFDGSGRLTELHVTWTYDDLTSLLLIEDGGYDTDGDGAMSAAELEPMKGFDMDWDPDFPGDVYPEQNGSPLALVPGPSDWTTSWADGKLTSTHVRRFGTPVDPGAGAIVIKAYDPGYYVAYAIVGTTATEGRDDCRAEVFVPDLDAAQTQLMASLKEYLPGDDLSDAGFPQAGETFAEEVRITCGG